MILKDEEHAICPSFHEGELLNCEFQQDRESRLYTINQLKDRVTYHIPNIDKDWHLIF